MLCHYTLSEIISWFPESPVIGRGRTKSLAPQRWPEHTDLKSHLANLHGAEVPSFQLYQWYNLNCLKWGLQCHVPNLTQSLCPSAMPVHFNFCFWTGLWVFRWFYKSECSMECWAAGKQPALSCCSSSTSHLQIPVFHPSPLPLSQASSLALQCRESFMMSSCSTSYLLPPWAWPELISV